MPFCEKMESKNSRRHPLSERVGPYMERQGLLVHYQFKILYRDDIAHVQSRPYFLIRAW